MIEIDSKKFKIQLWDTAGQERFRAIYKAYYRDVVGAFLVFDVKDRVSFDELDKWVKEANESASPHEISFVLVGNKTDVEETQPRVVSTQEAKDFARRFGMDYFETSAKTGQHVEDLLPFITTKVYWGVRVKDIRLVEGWKGVTEGNLCIKTPNNNELNNSISLSMALLQQPSKPTSRKKCCQK